MGAQPGGSETGGERTSDLAAWEARWAREWERAKAYESDPEPGRAKFFVTYPYSYMNAFAHIGHAYTMMRAELMGRYQRAKGKNVLFPFAYHITGTPIQAAANRIAEREPKQMKILADMGIPESDVASFGRPERWIEYFPDHWRADVSRLGLAIDWRRQFFTTDRNPYYDAFIRWQFAHLKEKGYVVKGRHPVIWCPKDLQPVADHDRAEGEGETPQEYVLMKFEARLGAATATPERVVLVAATLRPETMFGQTNLWVDPEGPYVLAQVGAERWVLSPQALERLALQRDGVRKVREVKGSELLGQSAHARNVKRNLLVLPGHFIDPAKGTGIVTSVPSDAPDDWMALSDLQRSPEEMAKHRLDPAAVKALAPIPIITTEGYGPLPAVELCARMGIRSQKEREKLQAAKEEVYKAGFYSGRLNASCGPYAGLTVLEAKKRIRDDFVASGAAELYYEPSGRVVCRCLTEATVKIVSDQWFIAYGNEAWKKEAHAHLDRMAIYPEVARKQFHIVVDWLNDWACARDRGLGTRLPWDERWIIESLSDSTVYMAFYTITHHLEAAKVDAKALTPAVFDFVFLGMGDARGLAQGTLTEALLRTMRAEFEYWYPVDFRNSGKDLLQNHLTFAVFNHVAIFPPEKRIAGISVNGWITVDGAKMSKSAGNFILLRQALDDFGVTATRLAVANAGEGMDDANFEVDFARSVGRRAVGWKEQVEAAARADRRETRAIDAWLRSALARRIREADDAFSKAFFRSALKTVFFDLPRDWTWYLRRCGGRPQSDVGREYARAAAVLLAPFIPHVAEEAWHAIGGQGFVIDAAFPTPGTVDESAMRAEDYLAEVLADAKAILKILKREPTEVLLYASPAWKRHAASVAAGELRRLGPARPNPGDLIRRLLADAELKPHAKDVPKYVAAVTKDPAGFLAAHERKGRLDETAILRENLEFLTAEIGCPVKAFGADDPAKEDPEGKAASAVPGRPSILVR